MLREIINGFCMALADSVPGVSGGTVAFIMGFYDPFIGSIHDLVFGKTAEKKAAAVYMMKLGTGWMAGMALCAVLLSALFESYIYIVSSLFLGLIAGAVPLIIMEERDCLQDVQKGAFFLIAGVVLVAGITWANGGTGGSGLDLGQCTLQTGLWLFLIGMIAISAMFLPGISGSTLLLIFGAYLPVMEAIRGILGLQFSYLPGLMCFGCGILAGAATVVKVIRRSLEKYRTQMVYFILGMMIGSFYAVVMGPTALQTPQAPLDMRNFHIPAAVLGAVLVLGMQKFRKGGESLCRS